MPPRRGVYSLCYNDLGGHPRCLGSPIGGFEAPASTHRAASALILFVSWWTDG